MLNKYEIGLKRLNEVLGVNANDIVKKFEEISPDFANYVVEFAYGELYERKGIVDKTREVAAVACLIGQGNTGFPLRAHIKGMLNVGWSKNEIIEVLLFLVGYVGFPSIVDSLNIAKDVFEKELI